MNALTSRKRRTVCELSANAKPIPVWMKLAFSGECLLRLSAIFSAAAERKKHSGVFAKSLILFMLVMLHLLFYPDDVTPLMFSWRTIVSSWEAGTLWWACYYMSPINADTSLALSCADASEWWWRSQQKWQAPNCFRPRSRLVFAAFLSIGAVYVSREIFVKACIHDKYTQIAK